MIIFFQQKLTHFWPYCRRYLQKYRKQGQHPNKTGHAMRVCNDKPAVLL